MHCYHASLLIKKKLKINIYEFFFKLLFGKKRKKFTTKDNEPYKQTVKEELDCSVGSIWIIEIHNTRQRKKTKT